LVIIRIQQENNPNKCSKIKKKCDNSADFIARSPLDRMEAWTYYFAIFLTSVGYPLASCYFTKPALDKAQCRAMSNIIAKCGFNRHTVQREVIYGPSTYRVPTSGHCTLIQGTGQSKPWHSSNTWRSPMSSRAVVTPCYLLDAICCWHIKTYSHRRRHISASSMESKWIASLRQYLKQIKGIIELDQRDLFPDCSGCMIHTSWDSHSTKPSI
jgi:hypothetical protein